jgi:hypothetical protein
VGIAQTRTEPEKPLRHELTIDFGMGLKKGGLGKGIRRFGVAFLSEEMGGLAETPVF